ncbi:MAG TPA: energy transducer TonB [Candidatus Acidoferrum sp.]|nr:energy transducer TonB [Candidatus Acidoferrum sp.]
MQFSLPRCTIILLAVSLATPPSILGRDKAGSGTQAAPSSVYPNTTDGLQQLLHDVREAAKRGEKEKVAEYLKEMEVPNCDAWLHAMYASDKADSWMGLCEEKSFAPREQAMQDAFGRFAGTDGTFAVRKVNDHPESSESGMLEAPRKPLDIYFATWKAAQNPATARGEPVGYFFFVDNGFRWENTIWFPKVVVSHARIVPAQLIHRVDPVYPPEAKAQHITGTVRVYYVIGGDGKVYNAHALSHPGLSEDPSLRKAAEDAVLQWRYEPATMDGKPIETNAVTIDVIFGPNKIEIRPF